MPTVADVLPKIRRTLQDAGIVDGALDARLLVELASGIGRLEQIAHGERCLDAGSVARLDDLVARRARREPLAYIAGEREFWSLPFIVTPDTLIPRPETETLVAAALARVGATVSAPRVLDLGTGSGCLVLALLKEWPGATGFGVDRSWPALAVARRNAQRLGLAARFHGVCSDWTAGLRGTFDVIVSNPPYLALDARLALAPEIRDHEPACALYAGHDGLFAYRAILADLRRVCHAETCVFFETDPALIPSLTGLLRSYDWQHIEIENDLSKGQRCVCATAAC